MARSMTGFGASELEIHGWRCKIEIRSVNQRFLDIRIRLPSEFNSHENQLREKIRHVCRRGKVECSIKIYALETASSFKLDETLTKQVKEVADQFERIMGKTLQFQWSDLSHLELLDQCTLTEPSEEVLRLIINSMDKALSDICEMKNQEGKAIGEDLLARSLTCQNWVDELEKLSKHQSAMHFSKLKTRISELLAEVELDPERLNQELALMSDRFDITEELVRLKTHLQQLKKFINQDEVGKKSEFLLQEINREINTVGSKSSNATISEISVCFKSELEKMREQLLNLE